MARIIRVLYRGLFVEDEQLAICIYSGYSLAPKDPGVLLLLAEDAMAGSNKDMAKMRYEEVLEVAPDNLVALNNLAWLIREENPTKALEYAQRANTINPNSPDLLDALAVVVYLNGDYEGARRTISLALDLAPDSPSQLYHSAMIVTALGDSAAALPVLVELMAGGEDFPESEDARALLTELSN